MALFTVYVNGYYQNPPVQAQPFGQLVGGGVMQQAQNQPFMIVDADTFKTDVTGVTFTKDNTAVAFFPVGQYRSVVKQG